MKNKVQLFIVIALFVVCQHALANIYYVSTTGNDATGDGSSSKPWRTLKFAASKIPANQGHTIQVLPGIFIESGLIEIPPGVSVIGAGKGLTVLKAASSFYYNPASPGYATEKFLISLKAPHQINGNQRLKDFTIDGDSKQLHGGIYVRYRSNVIIENVRVQNTNFSGIWLWDVKDSKIINTDLINCSWGSAGYCAGALNLGNLERVEIDQLKVDESVGYGIKAIGPNGYNDLTGLKIHDSRISVYPHGLWNDGSTSNIAIELWQVNLVGCEIYNTYVDNTISLVNSNANPSTGIQTIRVHHNVIDLQTRANGAGYGVELTMHDAEVDHNYFFKGRYGITNWSNPMMNWEIHHNVFYALEGVYPGDIVRSQWSGLHHVNFYNNTIELNGTKTVNIIGVYGGTSENINVTNNLFINNNTEYSFYPNALVHTENGAALTSLSVKNNFFDRLAIDSLTGTYSGNLTGDPKINKTGNRPDLYYTPVTGSPLIDAGLKTVLSFLGVAPDIGAYELTSSLVNLAPQVTLTKPTNNSSVAAGSYVLLAANASDTDGTISKVEFYHGSTKIGEDFNSPYSFEWSNVSTGNYSLTAKATDNKGATAVSTAVAVTVMPNQLPSVAISSPAMNAEFSFGSTITISATASDTDGFVAKVEFYNGTTKLGEDTSAPYSFNWSNVPAGSYSLIAKATDNQGAVASSGVIEITCNENQLPAVSITSPSDNANFPVGSTITIKANATDPEGTVQKVEFFSDSAKIGEDLTSPFSFAWTNIPEGSYSFTARVTDGGGATAVSPAVRITVGDKIKLGLYAPDAVLRGIMKLSADSTASKGSYFSIPSGRGANYYQPPSAYAQFHFNLPKTDAYVIWVRIKSPASNNQGYHVYDGKGRWTTWLAGVHTQWTWVKITDAYTGAVAAFPFTEGANIFRMAWFHENVPVDRILITNDQNYIPSDIADPPPSDKSDQSAARTAISSPDPEEEIKEGTDGELALYPNPVSDKLTIRLFSESEQEASISIKNATSLISMEMKVPLLRGLNNIPVSMQDQQKGMYIISIIASDGKRFLRKIMVTE